MTDGSLSRARGIETCVIASYLEQREDMKALNVDGRVDGRVDGTSSVNGGMTEALTERFFRQRGRAWAWVYTG
jgi:hypothetical protein